MWTEKKTKREKNNSEMGGRSFFLEPGELLLEKRKKIQSIFEDGVGGGQK